MEHYYQKVHGWFYQEGLYRFAVNKTKSGRFVEVGSWKGRSASFMGVEIINSGKDIKFDCVDTFLGSAEHSNIDTTNLYEEFLQNTKPIKHIIDNVYVMPSVEAAKLYPDNSLDFVFIDAAHDEANVYADCEAWYPKVKKGGIFGGDDYSEEVWPEVCSGVNKYLSKNYIIQMDFAPHWYIIKQ